MQDVKIDSSQESGHWWGTDRSAPGSCLLLSVKNFRSETRSIKFPFLAPAPDPGANLLGICRSPGLQVSAALPLPHSAARLGWEPVILGTP